MIRPLNRQFGLPVCKNPVVVSLLTVGLLLSRSATAQVDVAIQVEADSLDAPATITLTASTAAFDPVVDVRWEGLESEPLCRGISCPLNLNLAHCRQVAVEVTTVDGRSGRAEQAVCAADEGAAPPSVRWIGNRSFETSSDVAWAQVWVDGEPKSATAPQTWGLEPDGGCHVLDVWVADSAGRSASATRRVCLSPEAPQSALLVAPSPRTPDRQQQICGKAEHPLGRPVSTVSGPDVDGSCAEAETTPTGLQALTWKVEDSEGLMGTATAFLARTPESAPYTLGYIVAPARVSLNQTRNEQVDIQILGASPPYEIKVFLDDELFSLEDVTTSSSALTVFIDTFREDLGEHTLRWELRDARRLTAQAFTQLTLTQKTDGDGGVLDSSSDGGMPGPGPNANGAACASRTVIFDPGPPWSGLLVFVVLWWRRR